MRCTLLPILAVPVMLAGCAPDAPTKAPKKADVAEVALAPATAPATCIPVRWEGAEMAEPGVFTVAAEINGVEGQMQVDTGAFFSGLYGTQADWPELEIAPYVDGPTAVVGGRRADWWLGAEMALAGETVRAEPMLHYHTNAKTGIVGTVGAQALLGRIVRIDPGADTMCFLDPADPALDAATFAPMRLDNGYSVVELSAGGEAVGEVIFDTGSLFTDVTPTALARMADLDAEPVEVEVSSWGEMITLRGYPAKDGLSVGGIPLDTATLFEDDGPVMDGTVGTLGMSAFPDRAVILDLRDGEMRFGVGG